MCQLIKIHHQILVQKQMMNLLNSLEIFLIAIFTGLEYEHKMNFAGINSQNGSNLLLYVSQEWQ